jgi:hypothetical protein
MAKRELRHMATVTTQGGSAWPISSNREGKDPMNIEQFNAAVRRLDLLPHKVGSRTHIHRPTNTPVYVQDPSDLTDEERQDVIDGLTALVRGF